MQNIYRVRAVFALVVLLMLTSVGIIIIAPQANPSVYAAAGQTAAQRAFGGAYAVEEGPEGLFYWLQPTSRLYLDGFGEQTAVVELELNSLRPADLNMPQVSLSSNGVPLATFVAPSAWRRYRIVVPTVAVGSTPVDIQTDSFTPVGERRRLGVAVRSMSIEIGRQRTAVAPQHILSLLMLPLLGWFSAWQLYGFRLAVVTGGLGALLAWLFAALPAQADYYLPPLGWPWLPVGAVGLLIGLPPLWRWLRTQWPEWVLYLQIRALPIGAGLALLGLILIRTGTNTLVGGILFGSGAAICGLILAANCPCEPTVLLRRTEIITLTFLAFLAGVLRVYHLDVLPLGLWRDEAKHAFQALQIWRDPTYRPVYVVEGADLPALLFYLMAPVLGVFGTHVWSVRFIAALFGALMPLGLWWAARPIVGGRAALIGAALLTWASWALFMSRWAFPITLDQCLLLLAIGGFWRAFEPATGSRQRVLLAAMAGTAAGLATYGYHTGRMAPLIVGAVVVVQLRLGKGLLQRAALPALLVGMGALTLVLLPLIGFILGDLPGYMRRVALVSVFNASDMLLHTPLQRVLASLGSYLAMWHIHGDENARHHVPGAPMIDPITGLLFILGIGLASAPKARPRLALLAWLVLALVPGVFSANGPHGLRSFGVLVPTCVLAGLGFEGILRIVRSGRTTQFAAIMILIASAGSNIWLYFGQTAYDSRVQGQYDGLETLIGQSIQQTALPSFSDVHVFVPSRFANSDEVLLFADQQPIHTIEGATHSDLVGPEVLLLVWPADSANQTMALQELAPDGRCFDPPHAPGNPQPLLFVCGRGERAAQLAAELRESIR